jgi:hypothetical protein
MKRMRKDVAMVASGVLVALLGCANFSTQPRPEVALTDLVVCSGWSADGQPIVLSDPVPHDETKACVCSHFKTETAVYLQVVWSHGGDLLPPHIQQFSDGPFLSCIEGENGLDSGTYRASVLMGKTDLGHIDFSVEGK